MGESYLLLLGHFRHEIGHYYWDRLVRDDPDRLGVSERFGDESVDYEEALQAHYSDAPPDWQASQPSPPMRPAIREDWAETGALHAHHRHARDGDGAGHSAWRAGDRDRRPAG